MPNAQKFITEANKAQVIRLLGWSELEYCQHQEAQGIAYLQKIVGADDYGIALQLKNPLFWRWWVNHWNARDAEFLEYAPATPTRLRHTLYNQLNDLDGFDFYPHRIIMELTYDAMVSETINQATQIKEVTV